MKWGMIIIFTYVLEGKDVVVASLYILPQSDYQLCQKLYTFKLVEEIYH